MRKCLYILLTTILLAAALLIFLNISVATRQGLNYQVQIIRIPLYLKTLNFFDRHFNYKELVKRIVKDAETDEERAMKIFEWVHKNIREVPEGYPVIDDHVWNIIVRGYGVDDQFQDVFTTLCNYAKLDAFFYKVCPKNRQKGKPLSFVKLKYRWSVFDVYNSVYFKDSKGQIASVEDLFAGNWQAVSLSNKYIPDYYQEFFNNLNSINYKTWKLSRAAIQSPFRRFIFWVKNKMKF